MEGKISGQALSGAAFSLEGVSYAQRRGGGSREELWAVASPQPELEEEQVNWKRGIRGETGALETEIILSFLRLHPSTAFRTLVDHDG